MKNAGAKEASGPQHRSVSLALRLGNLTTLDLSRHSRTIDTMRRTLLSLAVLATTITTTRAALRRRRALASTPAEGSPQDEYVRHWAHEGKSRCGAPNCRWMREFGPIDVGCRMEPFRTEALCGVHIHHSMGDLDPVDVAEVAVV